MRELVFILVLCAAPAWGGDLTQRFELTLNRVLTGGPPAYTPELVLADLIPRPERRFTEYSGDVSGRYVGALAEAWLQSGRGLGSLDKVVPFIPGFQKGPGYFGAGFDESHVTGKEMALLWGNGRLLIGLLEYYQTHPKPEVLASARRIGDFLVSIAPVMNDAALEKRIDATEFSAGYICWTQNIEGLVALYHVTKDERYLHLAEAMAARTRRYPKQHSHGFLTSVRGIVQLYRETGDKQYLDKAEREWQGVIDSGNLLIQGAVPEAFAPNIARTEGCAEADWLRLSLALWQITNDRKYLDRAERTLFNEFAMNQFATGDFGHRPIVDTGIAVDGAGGGGTARAWWCCTLHGLRAFRDIFSAVFHEKDHEVYYDLPVDGRWKGDFFALEAESDLQHSRSVRLVVTAVDRGSHKLLIRRPAWSPTVELRVNNKTYPLSAYDGVYVGIDRRWAPGDTVLVRYNMLTRAVKDEKTGRVALFYGPWLLSASEQTNAFFWDEPRQLNRLEIPIGDGGMVKLTPDYESPDIPFNVPAAHFWVRYRPGGYEMMPAVAVLRPVAEQTGMRSTAWDFWFLTTGGTPAQ